MKLSLKLFATCLNKIIRTFEGVVDRLYSWFYTVQFKSCGNNFRIRTSAVIRSPQNIIIGDNFLSVGQLYVYGNDGEIVIGDNVAVNTNVQIGASGGRIVLGNNVLIAPNVVIRAADHGIKASELIIKQPHTFGEIHVEDDVWIGSNAVITRDVTLGRGTVVAAGAVVTKSTEPYSIVGGVPARKISQRI